MDLKLKTKKQKNAQAKELSEVNNSYRSMLISVMVYYVFMLLFSWKYPHYKHHRQMSIWSEIYYWIWAGVRRIKNSFVEEKRFNVFMQAYKKRYFVFALQVHNDFQIRTHSDLKCMKKYIEMVIQDFAQHADPYHHLVLKHHPMDRGHRLYRPLIKRLSKEYGLGERVIYVHDLPMPELLPSSDHHD